MIKNGTRVNVYNYQGVFLTGGTVVGNREASYGTRTTSGDAIDVPVEYAVNVDDSYYAPEGQPHYFSARAIGEADAVDL
jgi:hypothetical protein